MVSISNKCQVKYLTIKQIRGIMLNIKKQFNSLIIFDLNANIAIFKGNFNPLYLFLIPRNKIKKGINYFILF